MCCTADECASVLVLVLHADICCRIQPFVSSECGLSKADPNCSEYSGANNTAFESNRELPSPVYWWSTPANS